MFRIDGVFDYKKALYAAVAVVSAAGVGLIAYRLWFRKRPSSDKDRPKQTVTSTISSFQQFHRVEEKPSIIEPMHSEIQLANKKTSEKQVASSIIGLSAGGDVPMTVSETFEKVPPSASPVGFEEIGGPYVESMSLPSTPPLIVGHSSSPPVPALLLPEPLNESTMSFITVPMSSQGDLNQQPVHESESDPMQSDEHTSFSENNDIVVIGANSSQSSESSAEDAEVAAAVSVSLDDSELPPDVTSRSQSMDSSEKGCADEEPVESSS